MDVSDLIDGKRSYTVSISGIINAKTAKSVSDTKCESSATVGFTSIIDTATVRRE